MIITFLPPATITPSTEVLVTRLLRISSASGSSQTCVQLCQNLLCRMLVRLFHCPVVKFNISVLALPAGLLCLIPPVVMTEPSSRVVEQCKPASSVMLGPGWVGWPGRTIWVVYCILSAPSPPITSMACPSSITAVAAFLVS